LRAQFNASKLNCMQQKTASRTALATAYMRAAHQLLDPPPRVLEDPQLYACSAPAPSNRSKNPPQRSQTPEGRALRAHMVLRSRFAEDRLAAAVGRGVTQYVILRRRLRHVRRASARVGTQSAHTSKSITPGRSS
jgi:O-methyltransferase involved in polyketide biosynthesis